MEHFEMQLLNQEIAVAIREGLHESLPSLRDQIALALIAGGHYNANQDYAEKILWSQADTILENREDSNESEAKG